jgi:hypothetical protein
MTHTDPPAEPKTDAPAEPAPTATPPVEVAPAAVEVAPPPPEPPRPAPASPPPKVRRCENCETPLLGEHCYACGQPTKGLIRQFGTIFGDFVDTVFNVDSRVLRTLPPLLFKPGSLTLSYFTGHRIRYVSPVRLFVFLSILAFLAAQWSLNVGPGGGDNIQIGAGDTDTSSRIDRARTEADVVRIRDEAVAQLEQAKREGANVPGLATGMDAAMLEIRADAAARIAELRAEAPAAPKPPKPPGVDALPEPGKGPVPGLRPEDEDNVMAFNDKPWDAKTNPIAIGWLPAAANAKLNDWAGRAKGNLESLRKDKEKGLNKLKDTALSVVPSALFLLLPLFALMLKVLYLFKRRLYMEHMVVALHSHAFLCLTLLLQSLLSLSSGAVEGTAVAFLAPVIGFTETVLWVWMPLYLLLMQKRVYGQGWIMTLLKFGVIGFVYFVMLLFVLLGVLAVSLVRM